MPHLDLPNWYPIEMCGFTIATYDILFRNGMNNVGKLSKLSLADLLKFHLLTERAFLEVLTWFSNHMTTKETAPIPEPDWNEEIIVIEFCG